MSSPATFRADVIAAVAAAGEDNLTNRGALLRIVNSVSVEVWELAEFSPDVLRSLCGFFNLPKKTGGNCSSIMRASLRRELFPVEEGKEEERPSRASQRGRSSLVEEDDDAVEEICKPPRSRGNKASSPADAAAELAFADLAAALDGAASPPPGGRGRSALDDDTAAVRRATNSVKGVAMIAELVKAHADAMDERERIGPDMMRKCPNGMAEWIRQQTFVKDRNKREALVFAQACDALWVHKDPALALEIMVRRCIGLKESDAKNDWNICSALEWDDSHVSILPHSVMSKVLARAAQFGKIGNGGNGYGARGGGGAAYGRGGFGSDRGGYGGARGGSRGGGRGGNAGGAPAAAAGGGAK